MLLSWPTFPLTDLHSPVHLWGSEKRGNLLKKKKKINSICLRIFNLLEEPQKIFHKLKKFLKKNHSSKNCFYLSQGLAYSCLTSVSCDTSDRHNKILHTGDKESRRKNYDNVA